MSQKEFPRVKVIENAAGERLSVREASRLLQPSAKCSASNAAIGPIPRAGCNMAIAGAPCFGRFRLVERFVPKSKQRRLVYRVYLAATSEFPSELI